MLCERILGNLDAGFSIAGPIDWLDLTWFDCTQWALRKRSRAGVEVGVLLPVGQTLRHGDVLHHGSAGTIAVQLLPTDVWIIRPADLGAMGRLAVELGNLHVPVQIAGDELILLPDGPTGALLERHGVWYQSHLRQFVPERSSVAGLPSRAPDFGISRKSLPRAATAV
ncbi:MAG: ureE [Phycisphaerales bacterium]|nr:ureE [Phycisphaerales bacterium]